MKLKCKFTDEDTTEGKVYQNVVVSSEGDRVKVTYHGDHGGLITDYYDSFEEAAAEWGKYEEPKGYWFINELGNVEKAPSDWLCDERDSRKSIGNDFSSEEEAEKAVERLRAYKRLKDKGFRFNGGDDACISYEMDIEHWTTQDLQDFKTLFGGE